MGGYAAEKKSKKPRWRYPGEESDDPCELVVEVDLVGLQPEVSGRLQSGDELRIDLVPMGAATSAVCRTVAGDIVGTLAAFRGLAQLIGCIRQGVMYEVLVVYASATRCSVQVGRPKS